MRFTVENLRSLYEQLGVFFRQMLRGVYLVFAGFGGSGRIFEDTLRVFVGCFVLFVNLLALGGGQDFQTVFLVRERGCNYGLHPNAAVGIIRGIQEHFFAVSKKRIPVHIETKHTDCGRPDPVIG